MEFSAFMARLRREPLPHVFLLAGEERYYIDKARARILERVLPEGVTDAAVETLPGDVTCDTLIARLQEVPFFTPQHVLIVPESPLLRQTKNNKDAEGTEPAEADAAAAKPASKDKALTRLLKVLPELPEYSYLLFISHHKADKRKKLYKAIEKAGLVLEADPIRAWNVNTWLQGKLQSLNKDMDRGAQAYFAAAVSVMQTVDLSFLDQQLDTVALYSKDRRITRAELEQCFASVPEVSIFALLEAVSQRDVRQALSLLRRELADGTYFTVIIALLTRHVRQLWQAKVLQAQGIRGKALAKPLELNPFIAERVGRAAAAFDETALRTGMLELIDADYTLKTGQADEAVLEHAVITLCS